MNALQSAVHGVSADPRPGPGRRRLLAGVSLAYFMVLLDMTVLSVAEPDLAASMNTSMAGLQWATIGYTVPFAALLLSAGAVADRYGADRLLRTGVVVFTAASLLSAFAPALWVLVILRAVMGVAAAGCVPASMAMIGRLYPEPAARARAIATWAATSGAAVAAGPVAGGALVGAAGWRAVFLVNVPIGLLVLGLTLRGVRGAQDDRAGTAGRIDWAAQLSGAVVLALATDTLIAAGARQWTHALVAAGVTVSALCVFVRLERRSAAPALNRRLLRVRQVRAGLLAGAVVNFALSGALFVLPLVLQQRQYGPLQTGLAFLPLTVPFVTNPPLTGRIVARVGPRRPVAAGLALLVGAGAVLAVALFAGAGWPWLAVGLLATGFGVSFALPALAAAVVGAAPPDTTGAAAGTLNALRQVGATAGVAVMGAAVAFGAGWSLLVSSLACAAALCVFARPDRHAA
ncbi:MFS transporter [Dactylosporangium sp. NPDC000555]|uniref:MFS transporter n=1 Tax=Dactylosporangium sp. NPDC000555 TaxID=3154260 RepID=UPI00331E7C51